MTAWEDLNARARGLAGHLLDPPRLRAAVAAGEPASFARALQGTAWAASIPTGAAEACEVDRALGAAYGTLLARLARWAGPARLPRLRALLGPEEREAVRALLRGAAAGVASDVRTRGLTPTPRLPTRLLEAAAGEGSPAGVLRRLAEAGHPWAAPLLPGAGAAPGDLAALEAALRRAWLEEAVAGARGGGRELRRFVADTVDLENALALRAVARAGGDSGDGVAAFWVAGGRALDLRRAEAVAAGGPAAVDEDLDAALAGTPLAGLFAGAAGPSGAPLEERATRLRARALRRRALVDPIGPAPLLFVVLRARAELLLLRRALWSGALGLAQPGLPERASAPLPVRGAP